MSEEKYIATLVGCAVGDCLGWPVEGWKREQIKKYLGRVDKMMEAVILRDDKGEIITQDEFGKFKYWTKYLKKGEPSDDTLMTLAVAESIAEKGKINLKDIAKKQLKAYLDNLLNDVSVSAFGRTTAEAMKNLQKGISYTNSAVIGGPGNGPAMEMHSVGLYIDTNKTSWEQVLRQAESIGSITHLDPRSQVSGMMQAYAVHMLLNNAIRERFVEVLFFLGRTYEKELTDKFTLHQDGNLTSRMEWIYKNMDADDETAFQTLKSGSKVYESYPFAIFMFQKHWDDPINGLIETINYGGDCDTTGAIYGALCGAKNGMIFPDEWTREIKLLNPLVDTAKKIWSLKQ